MKKSFHTPQYEIYDCGAVKGKTNRPFTKHIVYLCLIARNTYLFFTFILFYRPALDSSLSRRYEFITTLLKMITLFFCEQFLYLRLIYVKM